MQKIFKLLRRFLRMHCFKYSWNDEEKYIINKLDFSFKSLILHSRNLIIIYFKTTFNLKSSWKSFFFFHARVCVCVIHSVRYILLHFIYIILFELLNSSNSDFYLQCLFYVVFAFSNFPSISSFIFLQFHNHF